MCVRTGCYWLRVWVLHRKCSVWCFENWQSACRVHQKMGAISIFVLSSSCPSSVPHPGSTTRSYSVLLQWLVHMILTTKGRLYLLQPWINASCHSTLLLDALLSTTKFADDDSQSHYIIWPYETSNRACSGSIWIWVASVGPRAPGKPASAYSVVWWAASSVVAGVRVYLLSYRSVLPSCRKTCKQTCITSWWVQQSSSKSPNVSARPKY